MARPDSRVKSRAIKRCFLSAPFGANLAALTRALDRAEIQWEWAKDNPASAARLPGDVRRIIREVDMVIGVLMATSADSNTIFEIGVAVGLAKPVLLVVTEDAPIPFSVSELPLLRASLNDESAINLHLDLLKRSVLQGFKYAVSPAPRKGTHMPAPQSSQSAGARNTLEGLGFEAAIASVLEKAGAAVIRQPESSGAEEKLRPDVLFWLPGGDPDLVNPVVIEAKAEPMTQVRLSAAQEQLMKFMQSAGVRTGLVIVKEPPPESAPGFRGFPLLNIFTIDFETFRRLLTTGRLAEHLRQERNRAAHGLR
jgi:Holliday junction resolvase